MRGETLQKKDGEKASVCFMRRERTKAAERRRRSYEDKRANNEVRSGAINEFLFSAKSNNRCGVKPVKKPGRKKQASASCGASEPRRRGAMSELSDTATSGSAIRAARRKTG